MKKLLVVLLLVGAIGLGAFFWANGQWTGPGPAAAPTVVRIPGGASLGAAATTLEEAGVIASADRFRTLNRLFGAPGAIRAGEYEVPAGASSAQILTLLQSGRTFQRFVAIPEGTPSVLVQRRLMTQPALTGSVGVPAEGSVLPDSYSFQAGETRQAVLDRMQRAMVEELARLWRTRAPDIAVSTPREAIVLASIVEKETGVPAERGMVAGLYSNRLRQGMRLEADPTVIYPVTRGLPLGRRILRSELQADTGYNTYVRAGLPDGPIVNPGRESIAAVLRPARTDALFMVADGSGGHAFGRTLEEHNANVQRWYALRRQRGEM